MNDKQALGVSEARYALTLLICLLLGIGYMVLNQLGGAEEVPPIEIRPRLNAAKHLVPSAARSSDEEAPQVLTIEGGETPVIQTSQRLRDGMPTDDSSGTRGDISSPSASAPIELR